MPRCSADQPASMNSSPAATLKQGVAIDSWRARTQSERFTSPIFLNPSAVFRPNGRGTMGSR